MGNLLLKKAIRDLISLFLLLALTQLALSKDFKPDNVSLELSTYYSITYSYSSSGKELSQGIGLTLSFEGEVSQLYLDILEEAGEISTELGFVKSIASEDSLSLELNYFLRMPDKALGGELYLNFYTSEDLDWYIGLLLVPVYLDNLTSYSLGFDIGADINLGDSVSVYVIYGEEIYVSLGGEKSKDQSWEVGITFSF